MVWSLPCKRSPSLLGVLWSRIDAYSPVEPLISKKYWIELLLFEKRSQKIAAAAILVGPKARRILVRSQCEITRHGLSDGSLRILEPLGGMHSTYVLIYGLYFSYQ